MTYGAKESNPQEGTGLLLIVAGLAALSAGWAYADSVVQLVLILLGIVAFVGGFFALQQARLAK